MITFTLVTLALESKSMNIVTLALESKSMNIGHLK